MLIEDEDYKLLLLLERASDAIACVAIVMPTISACQRANPLSKYVLELNDVMPSILPNESI